MSTTISLAVWGVPMPVTAAETFAIKAGAKAADGRGLGGARIAVTAADGAVVASGALGETPLLGTEALYWCDMMVPAPAAPQAAEYSVQLVAGGNGCKAVATTFSVLATNKPDHTLTVTVVERASSEPLADVEIRLGPFRARTDKTGRAELRPCKGDYQLSLWRAAHIAKPQAVSVDGDKALDLVMTFVPEDHPDARWVR